MYIALRANTELNGGRICGYIIINIEASPPLDEFTVMNKEYVVNEKGNNRRLYAIETDYNIDFGVYDKEGRWYYLYQPFEDNRLYQWEHSMSYILSFDYDAIYDSWKEDLEYKKKRLEKQLEDCVEALDRVNR